jgi:hypothetical protein
MHQPVGVHARADVGFVEQIHRALLDDAGANAAKHVLAGLSFENHIVDAVFVQELTEQQARRPASDDGNLSARLISHAPS